VFDARTKLGLAIAGEAGRDRKTGLDSGTSSALLSVGLTSSPRVNWGGELRWAQVNDQMAGSVEDRRSDNLGAVALLGADLSSTARLKAEAGVEGLKEGGSRRAWGARGEAEISFSLSSTLSWSSRASHRLSPLTDEAGGTEWARQTIGEASLQWSAGEKTRVTLQALSRRDRIPSGGPDIREKSISLAARELF
jgi:hypothetical protein